MEAISAEVDSDFRLAPVIVLFEDRKLHLQYFPIYRLVDHHIAPRFYSQVWLVVDSLGISLVSAEELVLKRPSDDLNNRCQLQEPYQLAALVGGTNFQW